MYTCDNIMIICYVPIMTEVSFLSGEEADSKECECESKETQMNEKKVP